MGTVWDFSSDFENHHLQELQSMDERDREREKHFITYTHKLFDKSSRTPRHHLLKVRSSSFLLEPRIFTVLFPFQTEQINQTLFNLSKAQPVILPHSSTSEISSTSSTSSESNDHECQECGKRYQQRATFRELDKKTALSFQIQHIQQLGSPSTNAPKSSR